MKKVYKTAVSFSIGLLIGGVSVSYLLHEPLVKSLIDAIGSILLVWLFAFCNRNIEKSYPITVKKTEIINQSPF